MSTKVIHETIMPWKCRTCGQQIDVSSTGVKVTSCLCDEGKTRHGYLDELRKKFGDLK